MDTYIFDNNQDKTNEKIQMIFMGENTIYTEEIGNMITLKIIILIVIRYYFVTLLVIN